ncbi:hypothetical protein Angca_001489, partial [Angiostrongylus cantonensis]
KQMTFNKPFTIQVRLYVPRDVPSGQTEFGLSTTVRGLEYFEDYFNVAHAPKKV